MARLPQDITGAGRDLITRAYRRAEAAHTGQTRRSGEPYFTHCVAVATTLVEMRLDPSAIAAALLHDTIEDTSLTLIDLEMEFGPEVALLVNGVTKLESVPRVRDGKRVTVKIKPGNEEEFLRKTIRAMDQDVRVILIKLADRLHNLRTLDSMPPHRQRAVAQETMEIFAPLAYRLGMWEFKSSLEDLSFRYLQPNRYRQIVDHLDARRDQIEARFGRVIACIDEALLQRGIQAEISLDQERIYGLYRRMKRKNFSLAELHNLRPIRVITPDVLQCYVALGIAHGLWRPVEKSFHDYIAAPRDNYYQSLHTTVHTEDAGFLTLLMRTPDMHHQAQHGITARWLFRDGQDEDETFERSIQYIHNLLEVGSGVEDAVEYIDAIRADVLQDRIYVITPAGEVIDLPVGSTPIDFAYHVHTEIGHRCRGAKVDGKVVGLDHELQTDDQVEILTVKRGGPDLDWLNPNLGYVKTRRAATKIRQWFRRQAHASMVAEGRKIVQRERRRLDVHWMTDECIAQLFEHEPDDFLATVGAGDITSHEIAMQILQTENGWWLNLVGADGLIVSLAPCCNPVEGQPIKGYATSNHEVVVHAANCPEIVGLDERLFTPVRWRQPGEAHHPVQVLITANDREGLMRDVGTIVAAEGVNMLSVHIGTDRSVATFHTEMEIANPEQLICVLAKLEQLPNVREARRLSFKVPHVED